MDIDSHLSDRRVVLLGLYALAEGNPESGVSRAELHKETGCDAEAVVTQIQGLIQKGAVEPKDAAGRYLRITTVGIEEAEEAIREEYYSVEEGVLNQQDTDALFGLMCDLEWERHQLLVHMYEFSLQKPGGYMYASGDGTHRALFYLLGTDLVETRGTRFRLSAEGREFIEERLLTIQASDPFGKEQLIGFLEVKWKGNLAKTSRVFIHSPDYRLVSLDGQAFALPKKPARIIQLLHRRWLTGLPDVSMDEIRERLNYSSNTRLRDIFGNHREAMDVLVKKSSGSTYRLNL